MWIRLLLPFVVLVKSGSKHLNPILNTSLVHGHSRGGVRGVIVLAGQECVGYFEGASPTFGSTGTNHLKLPVEPGKKQSSGQGPLHFGLEMWFQGSVKLLQILVQLLELEVRFQLVGGPGFSGSWTIRLPG